ncbi:hypothetical protein EV700_0103 [Fluviicoccus keumensis]|uniref:Alginate export domain-containing protein n=1 Tax=Fluviicoccus keumensis TaxID=1435465 RepID=A0A4Q7ZC35_9GAMM|nr:hypothetical protein [Fluviicoccus keumensis]RZU48202.1 hypothetical protein EV700_0103 [Fluviicoccus keumensis]
MRTVTYGALAALGLTATAYAAPALKAEVGLEATAYFQDGTQDQSSKQASLRLLGDARWDWNGRDDSFTLKPFARLDSQDRERSHADVREALWLHARGPWQTRVGIGQTFWGVTEGAHVVDIVNQTDTLETPEGDARLGQPMLNVGWEREAHLVDVFVLPGFRERPFAGSDGRLRLPWVVNTDAATYESGAGRNHVDLAARYQFSANGLRLGLSGFRGTSREPELQPVVDMTKVGPGFFAPGYQPELQPYYPQITQWGVDLQLTRGDWLWKLEAIDRDGFGPKRFHTADAGLEYTQVGVFGSRCDLGWLLEGMYDSRQEQATHPFEHDVLLGWRLAFNDEASSDLLLAVLRDTEHPETYVRLKGSTRLNDRLKLAVEARVLATRDPQTPFAVLASPDLDYKLRSFGDDSHLRAELTWFY